MTDITPTFKKVVRPTLKTLLESFEHDLLKNLNCVKVGQIQSYSAGGANQIPTATVLIAQQQVTSIDAATGIRTLAEYPLLVNVPVYFAGGGGFTVTFPVSAGDECLILFNDRQLENWIASGAGQPPSLSHLHDLSDGICLVGLRSNPRALTNVSATAAQIRSDDGQTLLSIESGKITLSAAEIVIHATTKLAYDAGGTGVVIQPAQIDSYTQGVTSNSHIPHPPEVPT